MNIDIIVVYVQRYERGHEKHFAPPITGIHLAALTPAEHHVRVIHQQVEPIDFDTNADVIMLSFFSGFAPEAYRLAQEFRRRGKTVVAGGPHVTFHPEEATKFCDSIVVGEVESVWQSVLSDIQSRCLKSRYIGAPSELREIPTPRYDLLSKKFFISGICVMAGFISGFDGDTQESIKGMAANLYRVGVDVPFLSILTPFRGTSAYERYVRESRMIPTKGWEYFNGYNVSFVPKNMSPEQLLEAHRALWREAFSVRQSLRAYLKSLFKL